MKASLYNAFIEFGWWFVRSALDRHLAMRRVLDYLPRTKTWWTLLSVVAASSAVNPGAAVIVLLLVFIRKFHISPVPSLLTLGMWEFVLYNWLVAAVATLVSAAIRPPLDASYLGFSLIEAGVWALCIYLYLDIFSPPRDRKKVKLPALSKPEYAPFVT